MHRSFLSLTMALGLVLAAVGLTAPEPAGACSLHCPGDSRTLSGATVEPTDPENAAAPPEWADGGRLEVGLDGNIYGISTTDGRWLEVRARGAR